MRVGTAALFMFPQWLVIHHKTKEDLTRPDIDGGGPPGYYSHLLKSGAPTQPTGCHDAPRL